MTVLCKPWFTHACKYVLQHINKSVISVSRMVSTMISIKYHRYYLLDSMVSNRILLIQ